MTEAIGGKEMRRGPQAEFDGEVVEKADAQGLAYYGIDVEPAMIEPLLARLKEHLGERFGEAVAAKAERDGEGRYHVTVVTPPEMRAFTPEQKKEGAYWKWREAQIRAFMQDKRLNMTMELDLFNVGELKGQGGEEGKTAYFATVESADLDNLRADLDEYLRIRTEEHNASRSAGEPAFTHAPLGKQHFHITLGFIGGDVFRSGAKDRSAEL